MSHSRTPARRDDALVDRGLSGETAPADRRCPCGTTTLLPAHYLRMLSRCRGVDKRRPADHPGSQSREWLSIGIVKRPAFRLPRRDDWRPHVSNYVFKQQQSERVRRLSEQDAVPLNLIVKGLFALHPKTTGHNVYCCTEPLAYFLARLSDIEPRFVCKACGKRGADVRPHFEPATIGTAN